MAQDLIRTIILPVLLLIAIVAIGVYFYRGGEGFFDYMGDLKFSYSGKPDPTCPAGGERSKKTGGICTGPVANTTTSTTTTTTAKPSTWIKDISSMIGKCETGVLVAQIRSGSKLEYYPYCFPNGITNADAVFNTTNKMTAAFSKTGTIATFYTGINGTGTIVGQLPQTNSQFPAIGQFPNMMFKSVKVVLPNSPTKPSTTSESKPSTTSGTKPSTTSGTKPSTTSGSKPDPKPTLSSSLPTGPAEPMSYTDKLLKNGKGKLNLDLEYDGQKSWPSYASPEHRLAHTLQASDLTKSDIQTMIQKELRNQLGGKGSERKGLEREGQVYCHDEDHEDDESPALKQGCAMKKNRKNKNKKKCCPPKLQCDPTDYSERKDNIPVWG